MRTDQSTSHESPNAARLNVAAVGALYDRQGKRLFAMAQAALGSEAEAASVVEAAFAHIVRIGPSLRVGADLDRLLTLLVHHALAGRTQAEDPSRRLSPTAPVGAPLPVNEAARMAAVRRYEILDTPPDGAFDRITALAARMFDVPIAIVSIVDHDRIWFKSHPGIDASEIGRDAGLCASAILQDSPWVLENAATDPRSLANPIVAGELGLHFYAGAPLHTAEGYNLGTLCVLDREPRAFPDPMPQLLADLAGVVVRELEVRLEARRAVREVEALLQGVQA